MKRTGHNMKSVSTPKTGFFALPCRLPPVPGISVPSAAVPFLAALASLCALAGLLAFSAVPAQGEIIHKYLSRITEVPAEGPHKEAVAMNGPLEELTGMTVDAGHLWLVDRQYEPEGYRGELGSVNRFDASTGSFEAQLPVVTSLHSMTSVAVRNETVGLPETELYAAAGNEKSELVVAVFGPSGSLQAAWTGTDTPTGSFTCRQAGAGGGNCSRIDGVAVDNSKSIADRAAGDVYVAVASQSVPDYNVVDVFKPEAEGKETYVGQLPGPEAGGSFSLGDHEVAVDQSNGDVLVAEGESTPEPAVYVFEPAAVVGQYTLVRKLTGTPEGAFKHGLTSLAVDGGDGDIYIYEESNPTVSEFDSEGVYLGSLRETPEGPFVQVQGLAVDPESHHVFVANGGGGKEAVDVFGENAVVPNVTTEAATEVTPDSAVLNGGVAPLEAETHEAATCRFAWGTSESLGKLAPCPEQVKGDSLQKVDVPLEGLQPDTTYYFRLQASNGQGTNPGEAYQDQHFTTPGPGIAESVSDVTSTSATLSATIDPNKAPTSYRFEYDTSEYDSSTSHGTSVPVPDVAIGSGESEVVVSPEHIQGLAPSAVYHYRVVVESEVEPGKIEDFDGPDQTFTTQGAGEFALPDGRAWELVSPPDKYGALLGSIDQPGGNGGDVIQAAADGNAITYIANAPTESQPAGYASETQVFSTRGAGGWSSHDLTIPHAGATDASVSSGGEYRFFSEDLSSAIVQPLGSFVPLSPQASEATAYVYSLSSGAYTPLVSHPGDDTANPFAAFGFNMSTIGRPGGCPPNLTCGPEFVSASPDASHVCLRSAVPLTLGGGPGLYEWSAGKLTPACGSASPSLHVHESVDGSWEYSVSGDSVDVTHGGVTKLVAVVSAEDAKHWTGVLAGETERVSPNGRYLAFMSANPLTAYDNRDAASGRPDEELYEYDAQTGRLACASCDPTGARPEGEEYGGTADPLSGYMQNFPLVGGDRVWEATSWLAADVPGWTPYEGGGALFQSRYLSNTGRLFFNARSALVPDDVNGTWDVYEYEPENVGSCTSSTSSGSDVFKPARSVDVEGRTVEEGPGCVGLISSGESDQESAFLEASAGGGEGEHGQEGKEAGSDVFFLTTAKLSPQDYDNSLDVYDAHECTAASPCIKPPTTPPPCDNESSCKASPEPQPSIYGLPSSATFSGPGNLAPPAAVVKKVTKKTAKCRRGFVKNRKGKCVAKKRSKKSAHESAKGRK